MGMMGRMNNSLQFGDASTSDYGIYISGEGVFNAPARDVEMVEVPGRNGALVIDGGRYANIEVKYPAFCVEDNLENFRSNLASLRSAFCSQVGYQRLTDTINPEEFRLGIYKDGLNVSPVMYTTAANFDMVFDCKPQRFLISGEVPQQFSSLDTITNPTMFPASPLIEVSGRGAIEIGEYSFTVRGLASQTIYIDCETMEAWEIIDGVKESRNDYVQYAGNSFPVLEPGANGITIGAEVDYVVITPRWWKL